MNYSAHSQPQTQIPIDKIHVNKEYESLVPPLTKETFESLVNSIRANGQHEPITVNDKGIVLDGHHRLRACNKLKIKPLFKVKKLDSLLDEKLFVIDANLKRRQLSAAQRVQLSLKKKPIWKELAKLNQSLGGKGVQVYTPLGRVNDVIAKDSGVSARQVSKVETILRRAPKGLRNRVLAGRTYINRAYNQIKTKERREKFILEANCLANDVAFSKSRYELFEGDFRDVAAKKLGDSSIDLIFTDPPYDERSLPLYEDLARVADRVLKERGSLVTYIGQYALPTVFEYILKNSSLTFWWQLCVMHSGGQGRMWQNQIIVDWKPLLWFIKGKKPATPYFMHDSIVSDPPKKLLHKMAQSPKEASHVIRFLTVEGQTVLDPLLGEGTTALAALKLRRRFIGIDIDPEALEAARANLRLSLPRSHLLG